MVSLKDIVEIVFPGRCVVCGKATGLSDRAICDNCLVEVKRLQSPLCSSCGTPLSGAVDNYPCGDCLKNLPDFDYALSPFYYERSARTLLTNLKYRNDTAALRGIKELVVDCMLNDFSDCQLIIPVPLHPARLRQRGFNQALHLCQVLFPDKQSEIEPLLLERRLKTIPQAELSGQQRRENLKNAFSVSKPEKVQGKTICLVDDVYTTGTTVNECSKTLKLYGCNKIKVLTLARVIIDR